MEGTFPAVRCIVDTFRAPPLKSFQRPKQWGEFEKGRADRVAGKPCSSANGKYLDGWYSVNQK